MELKNKSMSIMSYQNVCRFMKTHDSHRCICLCEMSTFAFRVSGFVFAGRQGDGWAAAVALHRYHRRYLQLSVFYSLLFDYFGFQSGDNDPERAKGTVLSGPDQASSKFCGSSLEIEKRSVPLHVLFMRTKRRLRKPAGFKLTWT